VTNSSSAFNETWSFKRSEKPAGNNQSIRCDSDVEPYLVLKSSPSRCISTSVAATRSVQKRGEHSQERIIGEIMQPLRCSLFLFLRRRLLRLFLPPLLPFPCGTSGNNDLAHLLVHIQHHFGERVNSQGRVRPSVQQPLDAFFVSFPCGSHQCRPIIATATAKRLENPWDGTVRARSVKFLLELPHQGNNKWDLTFGLNATICCPELQNGNTR